MPVHVKEDTIRIMFDQPLQKKSFTEVKELLKTYLAKQLHNDFLTFEVEFDETEQNNALFTSQDRYAWLAEKNKALVYLRKEFKLEID